MNYCTIQEAWGKQIETFTNDDNNNRQNNNNNNRQNISYNINYDETDNETCDNDKNCNCDLLFNHIKKCPKCYNKIKNYFKPKVIEYYHNIIEDNKDIITLILIGLFILLFYKLINNLTKS